MRKIILTLLCTPFIFTTLFSQVPCTYDNNQGAPNQGYLQFFPDVTAYVLVTPESATAGCSSTGDFVLTSISWPIADAGWFNNDNPANGEAVFQFGIYELADTANACAGVGNNIWLSEEYTRTVQNTGDSTEYFIPVGAIAMNSPFFVTWKLLEWQGAGNQVMCPIWDGLPRDNCRQFYSGNDGVTFLPHEQFFNSSFGWIDVRLNGFYEATEFAEVQFIHASADQAAQIVDIRVNGEFPDESFNDVAFKCNTNTVLIPAGSNEITINASNSTDDSNPIATFTSSYSDGENLIGVIHGIASSSGYNPDNSAAPLSINYIDPAQNAANNAGQTDLAFFNATTDLAQLDLEVIGGVNIASNVAYGTGQGYTGINTEFVQIETFESGSSVQDYEFDMESLELQNLASVLVALGFQNTGNNSNGEPFGLWVSSPANECLTELPFINFVNNLQALEEANVFPNPASDVLFIQPSELLSSGRLKVYNALGELLITQPFNNNRNQLVVSGLSNGFYALIIEDASGLPLQKAKVLIQN